MSCEQNVICYESSLERFWDLLEDYDFKSLVYENCLNFTEQWKEKEYGFNEEPYMRAFDLLWDWDCELLHSDIRECLARYINGKTD